eukprot:1141304-Pelagomonas_calceolata.AAC.1
MKNGLLFCLHKHAGDDDEKPKADEEEWVLSWTGKDRNVACTYTHLTQTFGMRARAHTHAHAHTHTYTHTHVHMHAFLYSCVLGHGVYPRSVCCRPGDKLIKDMTMDELQLAEFVAAVGGRILTCCAVLVGSAFVLPQTQPKKVALSNDICYPKLCSSRALLSSVIFSSCENNNSSQPGSGGRCLQQPSRSPGQLCVPALWWR